MKLLDYFYKHLSKKSYRKWFNKTNDKGKWLISKRLPNGKPSVIGVRFDKKADAKNFLTCLRTYTKINFEACNWCSVNQLMISQATDKIEYYVAWKINGGDWHEIKCENKEQSSYWFNAKANELDEAGAGYEVVEMLASLENCGLEQVTCSTSND